MEAFGPKLEDFERLEVGRQRLIVQSWAVNFEAVAECSSLLSQDCGVSLPLPVRLLCCYYSFTGICSATSHLQKLNAFIPGLITWWICWWSREHLFQIGDCESLRSCFRSFRWPVAKEKNHRHWSLEDTFENWIGAVGLFFLRVYHGKSGFSRTVGDDLPDNPIYWLDHRFDGRSTV